MELLLLFPLLSLVPLLLLVGWVLGIAGWLRTRTLQAELAQLRRALAEAGIDAAPAQRQAQWQTRQPAQWPAAPMPAATAPAGESAASAPAAPAPAAPPEEPADLPADVPLPDAPPPPAGRPRRSLEELLTMRWGVWAGAAALLLAGVFLIRYAAEEGLLGPATRCALAGLLGLALIGTAEWLRRRLAAADAASGAPAIPNVAPSALAAGGVAVLFGAAYGAGVLYALVPPLAGFALLAGAALLGMLLSLRQGPLVAAIGLVGAFVTPLLIETGQPSLPGLYLYLLAVTGAAMAVVRHTAWAWLGWSATVAGALWVAAAALLAGSADDLWSPALFVPATAALHLALLPGAALAVPVGRRLAFLPFAALAASGLFLVPVAGGLGDGGTLAAAAGSGLAADLVTATGRAAAMVAATLPPAVGLLLLLPVAAWKGWREPRLDLLPMLAAAAGLALLLLWELPPVPVADGAGRVGDAAALLPGRWGEPVLRPYLLAALFAALLPAAAGLWAETRSPRPVRWAALPAAAPVLVLLILYARLHGFTPDPRWAAAALALAALLVGAAARALRAGGGNRAAGDGRRAAGQADGNAASRDREGNAASRDGMAAAPHDAGFDPATAVDATTTLPAASPDANPGALRAGAHAAGALAALSLGAAMLLQDHWLSLAVSLFLPALAWVEGRSGLRALRPLAALVAAVVLVRLLLNPHLLDYDFGTAPLLNGLWPAYGGPALAFALAARAFLRRADDRVVALLEAGAVALATALPLLLVHHAFEQGDLAGERFEFAETALYPAILALAAAAVLLLNRRLGRPVLRAAWTAQAALAMLAGLSCLAQNPGLTGDPVEGPALLNPLLPAYLLPASLAAALLATPEGRALPWRAAPALYALLAGFAWVTLEVRRAFHGPEIGLDVPLPDAELWALSGAWLLFGALLMLAGIRANAAPLRLAALAVLGLTTAKVFLVDMSELVGLWRVLSFLGLGLALIGLGGLYQRFVVVRRDG
ncbi:DUF2339 domain-containing protein [Roseomonas sp. NAR14]|uniref:DUF2339 domain-containing protein n=1 Tax=Roseomonas acroporae TaxID=2937791 RepID=A0A9X1YB17_9PROT|nr:DUF2339 domain-containing protein [Roseomonas acroporae]MCK8785645.1 DUF2339 domain-containing protein [Roseomonas acroporae]